LALRLPRYWLHSWRCISIQRVGEMGFPRCRLFLLHYTYNNWWVLREWIFFNVIYFYLRKENLIRRWKRWNFIIVMMHYDCKLKKFIISLKFFLNLIFHFHFFFLLLFMHLIGFGDFVPAQGKLIIVIKYFFSVVIITT